MEHGLSLLSMRQRFNLLLQRTTAPLRPSLFLTARKTPRATIWGNGFFCQSFDIGPCARAMAFGQGRTRPPPVRRCKDLLLQLTYSTDLKGALLALPVSLLNLLLLYHPPYSTFDCLLVFLFINIYAQIRACFVPFCSLGVLAHALCMHKTLSCVHSISMLPNSCMYIL